MHINQTIKNSVLDNTYLESAIFSLWKIDILGFIKQKAALSKNFHIQPSELDKMPYWEYEYYIKALNDLIKAENEDQENQMSKYNIKKYEKLSDPNNIKKLTNPKLPNMNFKTPKL